MLIEWKVSVCNLSLAGWWEQETQFVIKVYLFPDMSQVSQKLDDRVRAAGFSSVTEHAQSM